MNASNLFSTGYIAKQIGMSHEDTIKIFKKLEKKPYKETRVGGRTFRHWHKNDMYAAMQYIEDKKKSREELKQTEIPFEPKEAERIPAWSEGPNNKIKNVLPGLDITVMETKHAEEMLSVMRSIDDRLAQLIAIWQK